MEKIESFESVNDTMSNRLFDCYRIALDFGLDIGNLAAESLFEQEEQSKDFIKEKS